MKNYIVLVAIIMSINVLGQSKKGKYLEVNFKVKGVCGMCESRIENALDVSGVRVAEWDSKTDNCRVVYAPSKITENEIHRLIAGVGHDTDRVKAKPEDYNKLNSCCKYKSVDKH